MTTETYRGISLSAAREWLGRRYDNDLLLKGRKLTHGELIAEIDLILDSI